MEQQIEIQAIRSTATVPEQPARRQILFRKEAVKAAQQRWFGPVLIVTPPTLTVAICVAVLAIGCLVCATVIIEVPERIRAQGVLLPGQGLLRVRASRAGRVDKLDIANGVTVDKGQVLMWLTDTLRTPLHQPRTLERIASLENELKLLDQSLRLEINAATDRELLIQQRVKITRDRLAMAQQEYRLRLRRAELQQRRSTRLSTLVANAAVSAHSADEQASATLEAQAAKNAAGQQVVALEDELAILGQKLRHEVATPLRLETQTGIRRESLLREISESKLQSVLELASPGDGIVAGLSVRAGSFVQSGQVLMTLHDPRDTLEAYLYVSADNAGMIERGQLVELQLRAYPHQLFGTQTATIKSVSAVSISMREIDAGIAVKGPVFEIRAALESSTINARGDAWSLPPGTVFTADLIRRRWPVYRWLLRSLTDGESLRA